MQPLLTCLIISSLFSSIAFAKNQLVLMTGAQLWPPYYMIPERSGEPWTGIWPGVVSATVKSFSYVVKWESLPDSVSERKNRDRVISDRQNELICFPDSKVWIGDAAKLYLFSDPIFKLKDVIVYRKNDFPGKKLTLDSIPKGEKIGVCKSWNYPELEPLFQSKRLTRFSIVPNPGEVCEAAMLKALFEKKVNALFLQPDIVGYLIHEKKFESGKVSVLQVPGEGASMEMVCSNNQESREFLEKFNAKLATMKETVAKIRAQFISPL